MEPEPTRADALARVLEHRRRGRARPRAARYALAAVGALSLLPRGTAYLALAMLAVITAGYSPQC